MFLWKKKQEKNQQPTIKESDQDAEVLLEERFEKAPKFIKALLKLKFFIADTDPMMVTTYIIGTILGLTFAFAVLAPFFGLIGDMSSKMPFFGGITIGGISWWLRGEFDRSRKERICVLAMNGKHYYADNKKILPVIGGELLFLLNKYGKPDYNREGDDPKRYGMQKTLFVEQLILNQFGSVRGQYALSYSDCKRMELSLKRIDYGILYTPRNLSEEQLLNNIKTLKTQLAAKDNEIQKLTGIVFRLSRDDEEIKEKIALAPIKTVRKVKDELGYQDDLRALTEMNKFHNIKNRDR